jgi:glycosyltransferase involved in cell wall biosynthesis
MAKIRIQIFHNIEAPYRIPLFNLLHELYELEIVFFIKKDTRRQWQLPEDEIHYHKKFLPSSEFSMGRRKIIFSAGITQAIQAFKPQCIIALDDMPHIFAAWKIQKIAHSLSIPLILWTGNYPQQVRQESLLYQWLYHTIQWFRKHGLYKKAAAFVCYGKYCREFLLHYFQIQAEKLFIGIQGRTYPALSHLDLPKDNTILYIGTLNRRKGIDRLLEAFDQLPPALNASLIIIGEADGSRFSQRILKQITQNRRIQYQGFLSAAHIQPYFQTAKVLILPSRNDPWGWVVHEALAAGLPVIVSDQVMAKEMVNSETGLIIRTPYNYAPALQKILKLPPENHKIMHIKARKKAEEYSLDYAVNCIQQAIHYVYQTKH